MEGIEELNAIVERVGNVDATCSDAEIGWSLELSEGGTRAAAGAKDSRGSRQDYPVVSRVGDVEVAAWVKAQSFWAVELSEAAALLAERTDKVAICAETLDAIIA